MVVVYTVYFLVSVTTTVERTITVLVQVASGFGSQSWLGPQNAQGQQHCVEQRLKLD